MTDRQKDEILEGLKRIAQQILPPEKLGVIEDVPNLVDRKEALFQALWAGPNRLQRIAQALKDPLKIRIDYYGIGRRVLLIDEIPVGYFPIYDKDIPEFASVKVAAFGQPPEIEYRIKRVMFPTFQLSRSYRVAYDELLVRLYPLFDRAKERIAIGMAIAEDKEIFGLLDRASFVGPNPWIFDPGNVVTRPLLADAFAILEANQLLVSNVIMHPFRYGQVRKWDAKDLDQVTLNVVVETGYLGTIMGANLLVSAKADPDCLFIVTSPVKLGRIPLRKDFEVKIADLPWRSAYYVVGYENIGFGIHNTYGVVRIEFKQQRYEEWQKVKVTYPPYYVPEY